MAENLQIRPADDLDLSVTQKSAVRFACMQALSQTVQQDSLSFYSHRAKAFLKSNFDCQKSMNSQDFSEQSMSKKSNCSHEITGLRQQGNTTAKEMGHNFANYSTTVHRGAFCQFLFRWIYYCHSSKSTGKETGKTHLGAVIVIIFTPNALDMTG